MYIVDKLDLNSILANYRCERLPGIEVRNIVDTTHPCFDQKGVFSTKDWEQYEIIGEYVGEVKQLPCIISNYTATLKQNAGLIIDAGEHGNETKYINHFKGIGDRDNVKLIETNIKGEPATMVVVTDRIGRGQEVLLDYMYDP